MIIHPWTVLKLQVLNSDQDPCHDMFPPFSDLYTGVAAIIADIAPGVTCDFNVIYRHTGGTNFISSNCTIRSEFHTEL